MQHNIASTTSKVFSIIIREMGICACCKRSDGITTFVGHEQDNLCCYCLSKHNLIIFPGKTIPQGHYTFCTVESCRALFKVHQDFKGKNPKCPQCRQPHLQQQQLEQQSQQQLLQHFEHRLQQQLQSKVPSLANSIPMIANKQITPKLSLLKTTSLDIKGFTYSEGPFESFCDNIGRWYVNGERKSDSPDVRHFQNSLLDMTKVKSCYFLQTGQNDEDYWHIIFQRFDGLFVNFKASCCYTGFDVIGGGTLDYATHWTTFWNKCLDTETRSILLKLIR